MEKLLNMWKQSGVKCNDHFLLVVGLILILLPSYLSAQNESTPWENSELSDQQEQQGQQEQQEGETLEEYQEYYQNESTPWENSEITDTPKTIETEESDGSMPETEEDLSDVVLKFVWERPSFSEDYEIAEHSLWGDPTFLVEAYVTYGLTRSEAEGDTNDYGAYVSFRPFLLDFQTFSIAFGGSFTGVYGDYELTDVNVDEVAESITADNLDGDFAAQVVAFSVLASFPEIGLQVVAEVGYAWTRFRLTADEIVGIDNTTGIQLDFGDYAYKQRDENFYAGFEIRKFFDREYFDYFAIYGSTFIHLDNTFRSSRADLTASVGGFVLQEFGRIDLVDDADPASNDALESSFFAINFNTRMFTVPIDLPIVKGRGISFHGLAGLEHSTDDLFDADNHGLGYSLGFQVSFWDAVTIGYINTWQTGNDLDNDGVFAVAVGLYGGTDFNKIIAPSTRNQQVLKSFN